MGYRLTSDSIGLGLPLLCKPFVLLVLAYRAAPLLAINLVERVSILAMRFAAVNRGHRVGILQSILRHGNHAKVTDRNTVPILTDVIYHHAFRNRSMMTEVRDAMSTSALLAKVKEPVAILVEPSMPQSTLPLLFPAGVESLKFLLCKVFHVAHHTPSLSLSHA